MLMGAKKKLADRVVQVLADENTLTAEEIRLRFGDSIQSPTIQGVYRTLRSMQKSGVIIKNKNRFSLRIPWIHGLISLSEKMSKTYLDESYLASLVPNQEGEGQAWYFINLIRMNDFWSQILLAMAKTKPNSIALHYYTHAWFEFAQEKKESQFSKAYMSEIKKAFTIVGNKTFLDRYTNDEFGEDYGTDQEEIYLTNDPSEKIEIGNTTSIVVIDDLVLRVRLDHSTADNMDRMYNNIKSTSDIKMDEFFKMLNQKAKVKIRLKKDKAKAIAYRNKYQRIFGPLNK